MGYDVALIGSLSFPAGKLEAWLAEATALANSHNLASLETLLVFSNDVPLDKPEPR